jgi:hypothetical protein
MMVVDCICVLYNWELICVGSSCYDICMLSLDLCACILYFSFQTHKQAILISFTILSLYQIIVDCCPLDVSLLCNATIVRVRHVGRRMCSFPNVTAAFDYSCCSDGIRHQNRLPIIVAFPNIYIHVSVI